MSRVLEFIVKVCVVATITVCMSFLITFFVLEVIELIGL